MTHNTYEKRHAYLVYTGLVVVNVCAIYIAGGTSLYATEAFREYGRMDLFNLIFVIEPFIRSIALFISGKCGEYFGQKKLYLWSVSAFAVTVIICAAAPNGIVFLVARSCSGFFWGLFLTNAFSIVDAVFPKEEYAVRIGVLQTVSSLIYIVGPVACGAVTERANWRVSLGIILPLLAGGLLLAGIFMPEIPGLRQKNPDGNTTVIQGHTFQQMKEQLGSMRIGMLFRKKGYSALVLIISAYTFVYCTGNYIPLYAQTELKAGVTMSAVVLVPCNMMGMLFSSLSGIYISKKGCSKKLLILMSGAALFGSLLYIKAAVTPGFFILMSATAILGIGAGIYQVMPFAFVQKYIEKDLMAEGTSLIGFVEGIASVAAGFLYSITMNNGVAFTLAFSSLFGIGVFALTFRKYKEPGLNFQNQ